MAAPVKSEDATEVGKHNEACTRVGALTAVNILFIKSAMMELKLFNAVTWSLIMAVVVMVTAKDCEKPDNCQASQTSKSKQTEVGKRIMCVGLVCVDIISSCTGYPEEDTDQRCADIRWQCGGNASNSCTVLSILGAPCEILATLARTHELAFVEANFQKYNICTDYCIFYDQVNSPLSVIIVNNVNGSRTILHSSKNLPEVSFKDFQKVDLSTNKYKWIHFEGRPSVAEIEKMITRVQMHNQTISNEEDRITISVELEKASKEMLPLAKTAADYVFMSKDLAKLLGFKTKEEAVEQFIHQCRPGAVVICAWGDTGAGAKSAEGPVMTSPAFSPDKMADTLGAGDTFNAATILALSEGCSEQQAITFGCQVAGEKCGMMGYEDLRGKFQVPQPLPKM